MTTKPKVKKTPRKPVDDRPVCRIEIQHTEYPDANHFEIVFSGEARALSVAAFRLLLSEFGDPTAKDSREPD